MNGRPTWETRGAAGGGTRLAREFLPERFALGWLSVSLSNAYMLVFFPILLALWCLRFLLRQPWRVWVRVGVSAAIASLPAIPLLWGYHVRQQAYGFSRPYAELLDQSASVTDLMAASNRLVVWRALASETFSEFTIFPGLCISILAVLAFLDGRHDASRGPTGAAPSSRGAATFYLAAAIAMWLLTLGPEPTWSGVQSVTYGPYWLLVQLLPIAQSIRVPARAWLPAALCLAVCAGVGATQLASRVRRSWVLLPLMLAIVGEGWFYEQTYEVPLPVEGGLIPSDATVLDLPLLQGFQNTDSQYLAVSGGTAWRMDTAAIRLRTPRRCERPWRHTAPRRWMHSVGVAISTSCFARLWTCPSKSG